MAPPSTWNLAFQQEIDHGHSARIAGNEGMARVCARRAAGIIVGEYLRRQGFSHQGPSAFQRLKLLQELPNLDPRIRQVVAHFLLTIDHDRQLPVQADLLAEAQWLAQELLEGDR